MAKTTKKYVDTKKPIFVSANKYRATKIKNKIGVLAFDELCDFSCSDFSQSWFKAFLRQVTMADTADIHIKTIPKILGKTEELWGYEKATAHIPSDMQKIKQ